MGIFNKKKVTPVEAYQPAEQEAPPTPPKTLSIEEKVDELKKDLAILSNKAPSNESVKHIVHDNAQRKE